jgi:CheY-like chemotaxis protein
MPACKILIIDDDDDIRESLVALLRTEGYEVRGAAGGFDGMAILAQAQFAPDAILLDLLMPGMSGEQFDAAVRNHPMWSKIPIIICSAGPVPAPLESSVFGVLRKPFDLDLMLQLVRNAVTPP